MEKFELVSNYTKILATKYLEDNPACGLNPALINKVYEASKYFKSSKFSNE